MLIYCGKHTDMFDEEEAPVKLSLCYLQMEIVSRWCKEQKQTFNSFPVIGVLPNDSPWDRMCLTWNRGFPKLEFTCGAPQMGLQEVGVKKLAKGWLYFGLGGLFSIFPRNGEWNICLTYWSQK